jgi:hypothetical protein
LQKKRERERETVKPVWRSRSEGNGMNTTNNTNNMNDKNERKKKGVKEERRRMEKRPHLCFAE